MFYPPNRLRDPTDWQGKTAGPERDRAIEQITTRRLRAPTGAGSDQYTIAASVDEMNGARGSNFLVLQSAAERTCNRDDRQPIKRTARKIRCKHIGSFLFGHPGVSFLSRADTVLYRDKGTKLR